MSNSKLEAVGLMTLAAPFIAVLMMVVGTYSVFANGYVLARIWAWYAVPLGAPVVGWVTFGGFMMAKSIIVGMPATPDDAKRPDAGKAIGRLFVMLAWPWFVLLLAWWIKS